MIKMMLLYINTSKSDHLIDIGGTWFDLSLIKCSIQNVFCSTNKLFVHN